MYGFNDILFFYNERFMQLKKHMLKPLQFIPKNIHWSTINGCNLASFCHVIILIYLSDAIVKSESNLSLRRYDLIETSKRA